MATMRVTPMNMPLGAHLERFGVLGRQEDSYNFSFTATVDHSPAFSTGQIVKIWPDANCYIRIGVGAIATTGTGEPLDAATGDGYVRYVAEGERISAITR